MNTPKFEVSLQKRFMKQIIFPVILLISFSAHAQWNVVQEITPYLVYTVHISGNNVYAGGDSLYISNDLGTTWRSNLYYENSPVTAVIEINNTIYAGCYEKGIFKSTDSGVTWTEYNNGLSTWGKLPKSFTQWGDTLFYATDGGGVYFTDIINQNGWTEFNNGLFSNVSYTILSMCKTTSSLIVGAGINGYYFIRPHGSQFWIERTINFLTPLSLSPKTLLAFGDTVFAGTRAGIFRSIDGGYNWDSVGIKAIPLDVTTLTNDGKRIYAGLIRPGDFFVWYSDNMGTTWNSLDHQFTYLNELKAYNNRLWAATSDGLWYKDLEITDVKEEFVKYSFTLKQNYPNPFNPSTKISYSLRDNGNIKLFVTDILGREITTLFEGEKEKGEHNINFNAENLSSGIYFCNLIASDRTNTIKMLLMK